MKRLHILNGDSSLEMFNQTNLEGDTVVWREMLSEGKSGRVVGSDEFWENRKHHLNTEMGVPSQEYTENVVNEIEKIKEIGSCHEIVLWFEYDLFCQINLMAALSYLKQWISSQKISLICVGEFPDMERLLGLGELTLETFASLFEKRTPLAYSDLEYADKVWEVYSSASHDQLKEVMASCPVSFKYLPKALTAHLKRFPSDDNGLNDIEMNILQMINKRSGDITINNILREVLIHDQQYGLGDMIYLGYLKKLAPLYKVENGKLSINETGRGVIDGALSFNNYREAYYFGGASITSFY